MMASVLEMTARLEKLRDIRARGISELAYDGETVRYRSDAEIAAAIGDLERQIAATSKQPVRRIVVGTTKGF